MPSARSRPRTRVVLPAPRSPRRCSDAARRPTPAARAAPRRSVAASSGNLRLSDMDYADLAQRIKAWGSRARLPGASASPTPTCRAAEPRLLEWLGAGLAWRDGLYGAPRHAPRAAGRAGARHAARDLLPHELPAADVCARALPKTANMAYVARYARGRDYHKVLRDRLQKLADRIAARSRRRSAIACSPTRRR